MVLLNFPGQLDVVIVQVDMSAVNLTNGGANEGRLSIYRSLLRNLRSTNLAFLTRSLFIYAINGSELDRYNTICLLKVYRLIVCGVWNLMNRNDNFNCHVNCKCQWYSGITNSGLKIADIGQLHITEPLVFANKKLDNSLCTSDIWPKNFGKKNCPENVL